jgi:hypothetical protein
MNTLYNPNKSPQKSIKNTGFKDKQKALDTLKIIKKLNKNHQMQIVLTMYYRAEYHPYKTKNMIEAQQIFKKWLINNGYQTSISNQLKIQPNKIKK